MQETRYGLRVELPVSYEAAVEKVGDAALAQVVQLDLLVGVSARHAAGDGDVAAVETVNRGIGHILGNRIK